MKRMNGSITRSGRPHGISGDCLSAANVFTSTSADVRSGWLAAKNAHMGPPSETPTTAARSDPAASSTERSSSARSSSVRGCATGSDRPVPPRSIRISRLNEASRPSIAAKWGSSQTCSTCDTQPGTSTMSSAPSPTTW
jgi:hypothetical protein